MKIISFRRRSPDVGKNLQYEVLDIDETPVAVLTRANKLVELLRPLEPNRVHAAAYDVRRNGWTDLGSSTNLRTTAGLDWEAAILGGLTGSTAGSPATATSATSLTATGTPFVASALVGRRVYVDNGTGAPVYGNIGANTTSVITVDQWWNADDTTGSTPSATAAFSIAPGQGNARFIGLTTNTTAPAISDIALTGELSTNGLGRALGTYVHTSAATSYTLSKTYTYTGSVSTTVAKAGAFTASTATAGGILVFETLLSTTATVSTSGDQLALTWTVNI